MLKLKQIIPLGATVLSLGILAPAQAANVTIETIQIDDGLGNIFDVEAVTSITNLILPLPTGDIFVDVRFQFDSFTTIFGNPNVPSTLPFFWNNPGDAAIALTAINNAINSVNSIPENVAVDSSVFGLTVSSDYWIPVSFDGSNIISLLSAFDGTLWTGDQNNPSPIDPNFEFSFAIIQKTPVPEPSSLVALMLIGGSCLLMGKGKHN